MNQPTAELNQRAVEMAKAITEQRQKELQTKAITADIAAEEMESRQRILEAIPSIVQLVEERMASLLEPSSPQVISSESKLPESAVLRTISDEAIITRSRVLSHRVGLILLSAMPNIPTGQFRCLDSGTLRWANSIG